MQYALEQFTFEVNNISSYELGKSQYGKLPDINTDGDHSTTQEQTSHRDLNAAILAISEEIGKVYTYMYVCIYLYLISLFIFSCNYMSFGRYSMC